MRVMVLCLSVILLSCGGASEGAPCDILTRSSECSNDQVFLCLCPIEGTGRCPEDATWVLDEACSCTNGNNVMCR